MNLDVYRTLSQPVVEVRDRSSCVLRRIDADRDALRAMDHFSEVVSLAEQAKQNGGRRLPERIIFLAEDSRSARQGALAWLSLARELKTPGQGDAGPAKTEADLIFKLFTQSLVEGESEEEDEQELRVSWEDDLLVAAGEKLAPRQKDPVETILALQEQAEGQDWETVFDRAENLLVDCFDESLSDELVDRLAQLEKNVIHLAVPDAEESVYYLKRLSFEQGYTVVRVRTPSESHYERLLAAYAASSGRPLAEGADPGALVQRLRRYRGKLFFEQDIAVYVDAAAERAKGDTLCDADFVLFGEEDAFSGVKKLSCMVGLQAVKKNVLALYAVQRAEKAGGKGGGLTHNNLVFSGRPGTGKSVVARIYSEILAQSGISNGRFVAAGRKDLVGKYLGHTAPQIDRLFREAAGGVLFIDEAGSLLQEDDFSREAVVELLRHMEEEPQTAVIFATYPKEAAALMEVDPGFSSRIRKTIRFPDYSVEELEQILTLMAEQSGYSLQPEAKRAASACLSRLKKRKEENFANAREARRLLECAIESHWLRLCGAQAVESLGRGWQEGFPAVREGGDRSLTVEDVRLAAGDLLPAQEKETHRIGFAPVAVGQ